MVDFYSKYSGEQVESYLDQIASGNTGGGITTEADPIFSASPAAGITTEKITEWNGKQDAILDLDAIRSGASKGASALQSVPEEYAKKEDIPSVPTKTSELTNDSGFVTSDEVMSAIAKAVTNTLNEEV